MPSPDAIDPRETVGIADELTRMIVRRAAEGASTNCIAAGIAVALTRVGRQDAVGRSLTDTILALTADGLSGDAHAQP